MAQQRKRRERKKVQPIELPANRETVIVVNETCRVWWELPKGAKVSKRKPPSI